MSGDLLEMGRLNINTSENNLGICQGCILVSV